MNIDTERGPVKGVVCGLVPPSWSRRVGDKGRPQILGFYLFSTQMG